MTIFFKVAAGTHGFELVGDGIRRWRRRRDLERFGLDDLRIAGSDSKQVGIGNDAEGLVIFYDTGLIVPFGDVGTSGGKRAKLWWEIEGWLEHVWVLLWETHPHFCPWFLVLPSWSPHLSKHTQHKTLRLGLKATLRTATKVYEEVW